MLLGSVAVFGGATVAQVQTADPPMNWSAALSDFPAWIMTAPNPWVLVTALLAGLGAWASIAQLTAPKGYSEREGRKDRAHQNESFEALDAREGERHGATQASVREVDRKLDQVIAMMEGQGVGAQQIEGFRAATAQLARSDDAEDRSIAEEVASGDPIAAADRLAADGYSGKIRNAERFRQAARIYAPFAPAKAMEAYAEAVGLDPGDVWSWLELGRLRAEYESLDSAERCFLTALQQVDSEEARSALETELGDLDISRGELLSGRDHHNAALAIDLRLAAEDADNPMRQKYLAVSYRKLGTIDLRSDNFAGAKENYLKAYKASQNLVRLMPYLDDGQRDLYLSLDRLSDLAIKENSIAEALDYCTASIDIVDKLMAKDPSNTLTQTDKIVTVTRLGDVELEMGNPEVAREWYKAGLDIAQKLAARDAVNMRWQRDLSVSHHKLGTLAARVGDLDEARIHLAADLTVAERLAALEPDNAGWQVDVAVSHITLAGLAERAEDRAGAVAHLERAETILVELIARRGEHAEFTQRLQNIRTALNHMLG